MEWKYVEPLKSVDLIDKYERLAKYTFSDAFRRCIVENNGGTPMKSVFITDAHEERAVKSFLSFNPEDDETIWDYFEWSEESLINKYVPFALDNFGNLICFDVRDNKIVFINHENLAIEKISNSFQGFLDSLYDLE